MFSPNSISKQKNILLVGGSVLESLSTEENKIVENFCGQKFFFRTIEDSLTCSETFQNYLKFINEVNHDVLSIFPFGNQELLRNCLQFHGVANIFQIIDYESGFAAFNPVECQILTVAKIELTQLPVTVHDLGIMVHKFLSYRTDSNKHFRDVTPFEKIVSDHVFQELTDSNKPTNAFRKGIYLSDVQKVNDIYTFHLLRCSSNFQGPTENFTDADKCILQAANSIAKTCFKLPVSLNHVLAQIYYNGADNGTTTKKARIKAHSDKTKDMPFEAVMAFCTFYKWKEETSKHYVETNDHDLHWKEEKAESVLTKLRFRRKQDVDLELHGSSLPEQFEVVLTPDSLLLIPLSTNMLYTHEIVPSVLPADIIPTRMGYVIRCSCTLAVYNEKEEKTKVVKQSNKGIQLVELEPNPSEEVQAALKELYFQENVSASWIDYESHELLRKVEFSFNQGDYLPPSFVSSL